MLVSSHIHWIAFLGEGFEDVFVDINPLNVFSYCLYTRLLLQE
jgi:hypothetical protein